MIITLLLSLIPIIEGPEISFFLNEFGNELMKYERINSTEEIPRKVFTVINDWKEEFVYVEYEEPLTRKDKKRFKFSMADVNELYNWGCRPKKGLPYRQLKFGGKKNSKYFISYNHGQGRCYNNKLLFIDLNEPNELTVFYLNEDIDNFEELKEYLKMMSNQTEKEYKRSIYIFEGNPYPDWLDFKRISF